MFDPNPDFAQYTLLAVITFAITFPGSTRLTASVRRMAKTYAVNWFIVASGLILFGWASRYLYSFPPRVVWAWLLMAPAFTFCAFLLARGGVHRIIANQGSQRRVVIVGMTEVGLRLALRFANNPYLATQVDGFFDDRSPERIGDLHGQVLLDSLRGLPAYVRVNHIDTMYLALPVAPQPRILHLLDEMQDTTASIYFAPDIFVTDIIQGRLDAIDGMPVVAICESPFSGMDGVIKRLNDVVLSSVILLLASPLLAAIALGVKLSSPGPILFRQRRYGLDGKQITIYKFRSMTVEEDGAHIEQAKKNDGRVTRFGAFLRRTSLDELPQFVNVLQGRMSIVGPRPHAVAHNEMYRKLIKRYMLRHKVKPGITGWAQVNGYRGETDTVEKMQKRIEYDLEYLRTWSLGLELWIIVKTVFVIARDRNAY
jgi:putative colanic acid biosynthesis UDP-glucose lipid carrier transferase